MTTQQKDELFTKIKWEVGSIQRNWLSLSESGAIEANPSTHRIAEYIYSALQSKEQTIKELREEIKRLHEVLENHLD